MTPGKAGALDNIRHEAEQRVATITFARPEVLNALDTAARDDDVRAVVITGRDEPSALAETCEGWATGRPAARNPGPRPLTTSRASRRSGRSDHWCSRGADRARLAWTGGTGHEPGKGPPMADSHATKGLAT